MGKGSPLSVLMSEMGTLVGGSGKAVWEVVHGYARQVEGMEHISPHSFRYYVGTEVTRKKGIRTAQITLGHKNISTTQLYDIAQLTAGVTDDLV